jgi:hypothetical protein
VGAEGQVRATWERSVKDFESRLGAAFAHETYLQELSALREQLRIVLSDVAPKEGELPADIAARIKALRAGQAVEAAPERLGQRGVATAEEPVTARLQRRREALAAAKPAPSDDTAPESETASRSDGEGKSQRLVSEQARVSAGRIREPG